MTRFVLSDSPATPDDDLLIGADPGFAARLRRIADDILGATATSPRSPGASFGVFGRWGMGKSSAAAYLKSLLEQSDDALPDGRTVTVRTIHAPNLLGEPALIKAQLGHALLESVAAPSISHLADAVANATGMRRLSGAVTPEDRERESRRLLFDQMLNADAGPFVLDSLLHENLGRGEEAVAKILVLDEVDRCSVPQTFELLRSIDYWLRAPLTFFVLVCDKDHLIRTLEEQSRVLDRPAEEALQKYVHHAVNVPNLLSSNERLRAYIEGLLDRVELTTTERSLILDNLPGLASDSAEIAILDPLFLWEEERTPRSVKQSLNRLLAEIPEIVAGGGAAELKRRVVHFRWPDFYQSHVLPVLARATSQVLSGRSGDGGRADKQAEWLAALAEVGRQARHQTMRNWGRKFAAASTYDLAVRLRVDVQEVPNDLILYLGSGPDLVPSVTPATLDFTVGSGHPDVSTEQGFGPGETTKEPERTPDLSLTLQQAVLEAQIARGRQSPRAAAQILRQLAAQLADARIGPSQASAIATAAVEAEHLEEFDLAWQLYRRAIDLDPDAATLLNAVDFLAKVPSLSPEQIALGKEWAAAANATLGDRPALRRLRMLARFYRKIGDTARANELEDRILEVGMSEPSFSDFIPVAAVLTERGQRDAFKAYVSGILTTVPTARDAYVVLRSWADEVGRHEGSESEAATAYLDLITSGAACSDKQLGRRDDEEPLSDVLGNLAILMARQGFDDLADSLWRTALARVPDDHTIRGAYGRFLNNRGDLDGAAHVVRGGAVEEPSNLDLGDVAAAIRHGEVDRWWLNDLQRVTDGLRSCL